MAIAELVLEFLWVLLSWPVIVLALGTCFLVRFKEPIAALLDRIATIRFPGDGELLLPQASMNVLAASRAEVVVEAVGQAAGTGVVQAVGEAVTPQEVPVGGAPDVADGQRRRSERENPTLWEYRFLNYFLVARTQILLYWLANRQPTMIRTFDSWVMGSVRNPVERTAMLGALLNHHLIDIDDELITVTPKGREYLTWRGPLREFLADRQPAVNTPLPPAPPPDNAAG